MEGADHRDRTLEGPLWHKPTCSSLINLTIESIDPHVWVTLRQTTRERVQSHLSADNWIKALLSKTLPTRARSSFPITSPSHQEAYPSLLASAIRGQTEETRRSSASQQVNQTILQKAYHDNKTGSCVPDERTRYNPRKLTK